LEALSSVAPDSPVSHRTVRCRTGQLLFIVWCATDSALCRTLLRTVHLFFSFCRRPLREVAVAPLSHRIVRWHTGQSGELQRSAPGETREWLVQPCTVLVHRTLSGGTPDSSVCQTRAHSVSCSFVFEPYLQSFIGLY
jgi:hypothetical protein